MVQTDIINALTILSDKYLRSDSLIADYKEYHQRVSQLLIELFNQQTPVAELLHARSHCIDRILTHLWHHFLGDYEQKLS